MERLPISCFIISKNEEDRIEKALQSVCEWVSEIVVVDGGSLDKTVEIAHVYGAKVISASCWKGYGLQKRLGEEHCSNRWLLNLDSDEYVQSDLAEEIRDIFRAGEPSFSWYRLRILLVYPFASQPRLWADDYAEIRLYNKEKCRFSKDPAWDRVQVGRELGRALKGAIWHDSIRSISHLVEKNNNYTDISIMSASYKLPIILYIRLLLEFPFTFFKYYFLRRHCMGGWYGFIFSMIMSFSRFVRIAKLYEAYRKKLK